MVQLFASRLCYVCTAVSLSWSVWLMCSCFFLPPHSQAHILARYKPRLNTSSLIRQLKQADEYTRDALENLNNTRHITVYYEDIVRNRTVSSRLLGCVECSLFPCTVAYEHCTALHCIVAEASRRPGFPRSAEEGAGESAREDTHEAPVGADRELGRSLQRPQRYPVRGLPECR